MTDLEEALGHVRATDEPKLVADIRDNYAETCPYVGHEGRDVPILLAEIDRLRTQLTQAVDETVERCAVVAESEALTDGTGEPGDEAYNRAIRDAATAIRAMKGAAG